MHVNLQSSSLNVIFRSERSVVTSSSDNPNGVALGGANAATELLLLLGPLLSPAVKQRGGSAGSNSRAGIENQPGNFVGARVIISRLRAA